MDLVNNNQPPAFKHLARFGPRTDKHHLQRFRRRYQNVRIVVADSILFGFPYITMNVFTFGSHARRSHLVYKSPTVQGRKWE